MHDHTTLDRIVRAACAAALLLPSALLGCEPLPADVCADVAALGKPIGKWVGTRPEWVEPFDERRCVALGWKLRKEDRDRYACVAKCRARVEDVAGMLKCELACGKGRAPKGVEAIDPALGTLCCSGVAYYADPPFLPKDAPRPKASGDEAEDEQ